MSNVFLHKDVHNRQVVSIVSVDGLSSAVMDYDTWDDMKNIFGIDEETVDAYEYIDKYDAFYGVSSDWLMSPPDGFV